MGAKKEGKKVLKRKSKKKFLWWILLLLVVLVVLVFFLIPVFLSSETGRRTILATINDSVDGQANFATLSMSWFKGIKVTDINFKDSAGQILVDVRQIATRPHYTSLLAGNLSFGETVIDEPKIVVNLKEQQTEKIADVQRKPAAPVKTEAPALPIKKIDLTVNNGNLKVTNPQAKTIELSRINSRVNLRPLGQTTSLDVGMNVVSEGEESSIHADAQITPKRQTGWSLKGTSGTLTVEVNDLQLGSLGPIFALAGVDIQTKGRVSANVKSKIQDGKFENLTADIKGRSLDITADQLKGDRLTTSQLDAAVKLSSDAKLINIEELQIRTDWLDAAIAGVVPTSFESLADFVKPDSNYNLQGSFDCDVAAVSSQIPNMLGLKQAMKVTSGRLSGTVGTQTENGKRKIFGQATLDDLKGIVDGKPVALSQPVRAEAQIAAEQDRVFFDNVGVTSSFARIDCSGSTESLQYSADVDLSQLQSQLGQFVDISKYQLAGQVLEKGVISILDDRISAVGSSTINNLKITSEKGESVSEPKAEIDFAVGYNREDSVVTIASIQGRTGFGKFEIKDAVVPVGNKTEKPMKLNVSAEQVDLQKVRPFVALFTSSLQKMQISGIAESKLSVTSQKDTYTIKTDSTKINNLKLTSPEQEPFSQDQVLFTFDGDYTPAAGNWVVRELRLTSPDIKIKFDFEKSEQHGETKLGGHLNYEWDWAAVSSIVSPFLPAGFKIKGKRADTLSLSCQYPTDKPEQLLSNLQTRGKIGFEQAEYMGLDFGPTDVDIQISRGVLNIAPFSSAVNQGKLSFAANADFNKKPSLLRTPQPIQVVKDIHINDKVSNSILRFLNPIFANAVDVTGIANFQCDTLAIPIAGGAKEDIKMNGTISITQIDMKPGGFLGSILSKLGSSQGQSMTIHPTKFTVADGYVSYDDMQLDIGNNPCNFSGNLPLDLDEKIKDFTITVPYTFGGRTVRTGKETEGERITLTVKGTLRKPEVDWGKLIQEGARELLKEEVRKGIEDIFKR